MRGGGVLAAGLLAGLLAAACGEEPRHSVPASAAAAAALRFADATEASGIRFVHANGASPRRYLPETMGAGVAAFDYDGDGWVDLFFVNGEPVDGASAEAPPPGGVLYRNLGGGRFAPVAAGVEAPFLGMGAAVGDVDNDGDADLFVTGVGGDRLFVNRGDGSFADGAAAAGLVARGFGSSAAFLDADRDGRLDLYAGRYVEWSPETDVACSPDGEHPSYCTPEVYRGASSRFYRNATAAPGAIHFVDATRESGLWQPEGKALGVVPLDHDLDGWPDLAVANDTARNFLFVNQRDATFREIGVESGMAYAASGATRGGMGIDAGDLAGRGVPDLVIGNFAQEMAALYRAAPGGLYTDEAAEAGIGLPSLMTLAFGTLLVDCDLDGWLDIVLANGHIEPEIARFQASQSYAQPMQLFRRQPGAWEFREEEGGADDPLRVPRVGRGLAELDFDRDGDPDLALTQNGGEAVLLRNEVEGSAWLRLGLVGRASNRDGYGARVAVSAGELRLVRTLVSGRSYLSASEPALTIGLGGEASVESLDIWWPSGARQRLLAPPALKHLRLWEPAAN